VIKIKLVARVCSILNIHHDETEATDLVHLPNVFVPAELVRGSNAKQANYTVVWLDFQQLVTTASTWVDVGQ
jgi:hypothetical protein